MILYTIAEAATELRVSEDTVLRRIKDARLSPARVGRGILLTENDIAAIVEASRWRSPSFRQASAKGTKATSREAGSAAGSRNARSTPPTKRLLDAVCASWKPPSSRRNRATA